MYNFHLETPSHKYPISPYCAQCVIGRYGYLWSSQRMFQRHLTQDKIYLQFEWIGVIPTKYQPLREDFDTKSLFFLQHFPRVSLIPKSLFFLQHLPRVSLIPRSFEEKWPGYLPGFCTDMTPRRLQLHPYKQWILDNACYLIVAMWLFVMCKRVVVAGKTRYKLTRFLLVICRRTACRRSPLTHRCRYTRMIVSTN